MTCATPAAKRSAKPKAVFQKVMAKEENNPICWVARAWYGRCIRKNGDDAQARSEYDKIIEADSIAPEAQRLARYFRLLVIREKPEGQEDDAYIIRAAKDWITDYSGYLKTPEGYGVRYLLAKSTDSRRPTRTELQRADKMRI